MVNKNLILFLGIALLLSACFVIAVQNEVQMTGGVNASTDPETNITTYTFNSSEDCARLKGHDLCHIAPNGSIKADPNGTIMWANFSTDSKGGNYYFGDNKVSIPGNSSVLYENGTLSISLSNSSQIQYPSNITNMTLFYYASNSSVIRLPGNNSLNLGTLGYANGTFFIPRWNTTVINNFSITPSSDLNVFFGNVSSNLSGIYFVNSSFIQLSPVLSEMSISGVSIMPLSDAVLADVGSAEASIAEVEEIKESTTFSLQAPGDPQPTTFILTPRGEVLSNNISYNSITLTNFQNVVGEGISDVSLVEEGERLRDEVFYRIENGEIDIYEGDSLLTEIAANYSERQLSVEQIEQNANPLTSNLVAQIEEDIKKSQNFIITTIPAVGEGPETGVPRARALITVLNQLKSEVLASPTNAATYENFLERYNQIHF